MKLHILFFIVNMLLVWKINAYKDETIIHSKLQDLNNIQNVADTDDGLDVVNDDIEENDDEENVKKNVNEQFDLEENIEEKDILEAAEIEDTDDTDDIEEENDDDSENSQEQNDDQNLVDPCENVVCGRGEECVSIRGEATCRCRTSCPPTLADADKLCGSDNETYDSLCELERTKCLYIRDKVKGAKHLRLRYYGPCKVLPKCHKEEFGDFPLRMRSWIKNVYLQLYDEPAEGLPETFKTPGRRLAANRDRLLEFEQSSFESMEQNMGQYQSLYRLPVYWKFVSLDVDPEDGFLSKKELEPLVATLIPLEPCSRAFFKKADLNRDRLISKQEWGLAMKLGEDDMDMSDTL